MPKYKLWRVTRKIVIAGRVVSEHVVVVGGYREQEARGEAIREFPQVEVQLEYNELTAAEQMIYYAER